MTKKSLRNKLDTPVIRSMDDSSKDVFTNYTKCYGKQHISYESFFTHTLITLPSLASATANSACASLATIFFRTFFKPLPILPSINAVAAGKKYKVGNFVKWSKC